jgi:hypothetical protein
MARKMNARTQGLKNFAQMALNQLERGDVTEAKYTLQSLIDDIGGAYVCVDRKPKASTPVPKYDPKKDGDYRTWLVMNNMD